MENQIEQVLSEIEAAGGAVAAPEIDPADATLESHPDTARFISKLALDNHCTRLLELGTSNGYSLICLAWAARETGGRVVGIDHDRDKQAAAAGSLQRAGLSEYATLRTGDAAEILSVLDGPFDFVFLNADRRSYAPLLVQLLSKLTDGAFVVADNVHSHPEEIAGYLSALSARDDFDHRVEEVGAGLSIAHYHPE